MKLVYFLLLFVDLLPRNFAVPERPNYLTIEDFERGRSPVYSNETSLNRNDYPHETHIPHPRRSKRNAYIFDVYQWPNARVPYVLDTKFNDNQRAIIASAMNEYHTKTCVRFEKRLPNDVDYVQLQLDDTVCGSSTFCRQGGVGYSKFGTTCINVGKEIVVHELSHALCFSHETDRSDRDDYISFNTSICKPYGKNTVTDSTNLDLMYDYLSVQHYEPPFVDGCIIPKLPGVTKCGSGGGLSVLDAEKINAYYKCGGCYSYRFRPINLLTKDDILFPGGVDTDGMILYPCRGYYNGDIRVGKSKPSLKECWFQYGGVERKLTEKFDVLTNPKNANLNWKKGPADGTIPANAIPGGRTARRETLYICRCTLQFNGKSTTLTGIVWVKSCWVSYGGGEYGSSDFEYLLCG